MLTSVEKYDVLTEIGRGGMATVYRARDRRLQRLVALKVMHPHLQGAKEARTRFAREALTIARLRHPGLLEIFDYSGEDSEISYIATELLEGPTLKIFVEAQPEIPAEMAACMALQVAEALSAAHVAGVIHRDVKPENVMFHRGKVKLTDFGIAQLMDAQGMTTTGQVLGSPGHMAPEQIEGKECSARTDVFALGTVLYQLATGEPPFPGRNPHQILKLIIEGRVRDPVRVRGSIGAKLARIIMRCLATDPAHRFATAEALAQALRDFLTEAGIEQPEVRLQEYLRDTEGFATAFRKEVIQRQTLLGESAQRAGRYPEALDHWNRVLAIDPGNSRVMLAVRRLGLRSRLRRLAGLGLSLSAVVALLWVGWHWWEALHPPPARLSLGPVVLHGHQGPAGSPPIEVVSERQPGVAGGPHTPDPDAALAGQEAGSGTPESGGGRRPGAVGSGSLAGLKPDKPGAEAAVAGRIASGEEVDPSKPRRVVFSPTPANVSIGVDGQKPRPFGPSFRQVELLPGEHRFRFVGAHDCCVDDEFTRVIEPGSEPVVIDHRLSFRPAGLYVVTNVLANVTVDGGQVHGRARSVIDVPQSALMESHTVEVTAKGYMLEQRSVQLRAGEVREITLELRRQEPGERDEG